MLDSSCINCRFNFASYCETTYHGIQFIPSFARLAYIKRHHLSPWRFLNSSRVFHKKPYMMWAAYCWRDVPNTFTDLNILIFLYQIYNQGLIPAHCFPKVDKTLLCFAYHSRLSYSFYWQFIPLLALCIMIYGVKSLAVPFSVSRCYCFGVRGGGVVFEGFARFKLWLYQMIDFSFQTLFCSLVFRKKISYRKCGR